MEEEKKQTDDLSDFMVRSEESRGNMKKGIYEEPKPIRKFYEKGNERLSQEEGELKCH